MARQDENPAAPFADFMWNIELPITVTSYLKIHFHRRCRRICLFPVLIIYFHLKLIGAYDALHEFCRRAVGEVGETFGVDDDAVVRLV